MLKILQARLQQYVNRELPEVQVGFRKGRRARDQIANICWIIKKAKEFQKNIYFCFIDYAKAFDCMDHNKLENSEADVNARPPDLPLEKSVCRFLRRQIRWSGIAISWRIFQFVVIHAVKCFGIVNKAEVDVFLELSCFFYDPTDVGNLISGSSAFSIILLLIYLCPHI